MFERCVQRIKRTIVKKAVKIGKDSLRKKEKIRSEASAKNELMDTTLVITNIKNQVLKTKIKRCGKPAQSTPAAVATPFPPRKPKNGVNTWPSIAANPTQTGQEVDEKSG